MTSHENMIEKEKVARISKKKFLNNRKTKKNNKIIKNYIEILKDCVKSLILIAKFEIEENIEENNIPNKIIEFNIGSKNMKSILSKLENNTKKKIIKKSITVDDSDLFIKRLYNLPLDYMLKSNNYRITIINLLRKLPSNIFNNLLINKISQLNPHIKPHKFHYAISYDVDYNDDNDRIYNLDLSNMKLKKLPEIFGALNVRGHIYLNDNNLTTLPDSFGDIKVGNYLFLMDNPLENIPDNFTDVKEVFTNENYYSN